MATDFQSNLYEYLASYIKDSGSSPSYAEIIAAMRISPNSKSLITRSLRALNKEGKILLEKDGRRLLISLSSKHLPLLGRISAGLPIEAISDEQSIDVNELFYGRHHFALLVKGNSMIEDGIFDGDMIVCKQTNTASEGDVIVALIDGYSTTLKRISYKVKNMITLVPSNHELKPKAYTPERIQVQGIYIGLIRVSEKPYAFPKKL